jgi:hypothetical protein
MIRKMQHKDFLDVNRIFMQVQMIHVNGRKDIFLPLDPCPYR